MRSTPLQDIINRPKQTRNNSPFISYSSSKRQSVVLSQNSNYSDKPKPDEKTLQQLYSLFKQQGLDNVNGLLKFLDVYKQQRKSQSPLLRTQQEEVVDREKFSQMIVEAKQGLNKLQHRISAFGDSRNAVNKYKNLISEEEENHEYMYENRSDYKRLYEQAIKDQEIMQSKITNLIDQGCQRDKVITTLQTEMKELQQQMLSLTTKFEERSQSPRPSISQSASDYTFTLQVCNSDFQPDFKQDAIQIKDYLHTQSQQIKRL